MRWPKLLLHKKDGTESLLPVPTAIKRPPSGHMIFPKVHFLHQKAAVFESWPVKGEEYQGHSYKATFQFSSPQPVKKITIRYLNPMGNIEIKKILLDQEDLKNLVKRKFELGVPFIFKNASAFPRVFTIGRAMVLTSEKEILKKLRELDPRECCCWTGFLQDIEILRYSSTEEAKHALFPRQDIEILHLVRPKRRK